MFKIVSITVNPKRVICYSPEVGRTRYYRQHEESLDKGLKVLTYKKKSYAEEIAAELNEAWQEWNWHVEEIA